MRYLRALSLQDYLPSVSLPSQRLKKGNHLFLSRPLFEV